MFLINLNSEKVITKYNFEVNNKEIYNDFFDLESESKFDSLFFSNLFNNNINKLISDKNLLIVKEDSKKIYDNLNDNEFMMFVNNNIYNDLIFMNGKYLDIKKSFEKMIDIDNLFNKLILLLKDLASCKFLKNLNKKFKKIYDKFLENEIVEDNYLDNKIKGDQEVINKFINQIENIKDTIIDKFEKEDIDNLYKFINYLKISLDKIKFDIFIVEIDKSDSNNQKIIIKDLDKNIIFIINKTIV